MSAERLERAERKEGRATKLCPGVLESCSACSWVGLGLLASEREGLRSAARNCGASRREGSSSSTKERKERGNERTNSFDSEIAGLALNGVSKG